MPKCLMCGNISELQNSHAIPDAFFRRILKSNSGKAIVVPGGGNESIHYSGDSWATDQLCASCEKLLNLSYEKYAIKTLRGSGCKVVKHTNGVTFSAIDGGTLVSFFISVFWRAANSKHPNYSKVMIPEPWNSEIRNRLYHKQNIPMKLASVKVSRLIDRTPKDGFTLESLKGLMITPFFRKVAHRRYSFCFNFEGFFIEIFTPGLPLKERKEFGVLTNKSEILSVPFLDIFDVPEIEETLVEGYGKYVDGEVTFEN
ncbi:TPA: hypothetical protein NGV35_004577 [Vibrio parahaemolyticus]|nr:hypothetical protein [Vibrio parahaemolyticus]HCE4642779.1 hypothetical protein [Vibrio parahaemolyticus]